MQQDAADKQALEDALEGGVQVDKDGTKFLTLPSGLLARIRRGTGKDVLRATQLINPQRDPQVRMILALVALKTKIAEAPPPPAEGQEPVAPKWKDLTLEDVEDLLSDTDVFRLMGEVQSGGKSSLPST